MSLSQPFIRLISGNLFCIALIITALYSPVTKASESSEATIITNTFSSYNNSVKKCELLFSLRKYLPQKPLWIKELLGKALTDKSPVVAAEAVYQIGEFRFTEYNSDLIKLYNDAEKRFSSLSYAERVRCAIIQALGKIGNSEAKVFISGLLKNDRGSYIGQFLLSAIESLNDPVFVNDVKLYKIKMEKYVKSAEDSGLDPFLYSVQISYIKRTVEIEKFLLKGKK